MKLFNINISIKTLIVTSIPVIIALAYYFSQHAGRTTY